jgi:Brp/Blh family beta-carotene 15,15'-monooxygenase
MLAVAALYLALGGGYLALWFAAPVAAFVLFIGLTWWHWGTGDLWSLTALVAPGRAVGGPFGRTLVALSRGGLPMLVPLLAFPDEYRAVARSVTGLFAPDIGADALAWAFGPRFRLAVGVGFLVLVLAALVLERRAGGPWRADAEETALLAVYFALVPPVLAVGLYFCLWHATRHVARLALLDGASLAALGAGRIGPALGRFARDAAPLTALALLMLAGLALMVPDLAGGSRSLLAVYLVLISALTLPHVVVVGYMDVREGLWR